MQAFVTVVIPTYNRLLFLRQAIDSVIAQDYDNWELIIVDDGSTDGSAEAIKTMQDKRIGVLSLSHTGNIAALRNAGVAAGSGEWVAFLDSDDLWVKEKLSWQLAYLEQKKTSWCYGNFELVDKAGAVIPRYGTYEAMNGWIAEALLSDKTAVNISSLVLKRSLFDGLGGFNEAPEFFLREDYEFALRLSMKENALALSQVLVKVREHVDRSTYLFGHGHLRSAYLFGHCAGLCSDRRLKKIAKRRQASHLAEAGGDDIRQRKYAQAAGNLFRAFSKGDTIRHIFSVIKHSGKNTGRATQSNRQD